MQMTSSLPNQEFTNQEFFNPKNVGDIEDPTATGRAGSLACGATIRITLAIGDEQIIQDAKFRTAGCSYLVAFASVLTGKVKGQSTGAAAALANNPKASWFDEFGTPPPDKQQCRSLVSEALISAIQQYSDTVRDEWEGDEALICTCFGVSEQRIEQEIRRGRLQTIAEVTRACKAGAGCRSCYPLIEDILGMING